MEEVDVVEANMHGISELACTDAIDLDAAAELRSRVLAFNISATGYADGRSLCCFVRGASGALVAGLDGYTWGAYAMIEWLWVAEHLRSLGVGSKLVGAAELEAQARGCRVVRVNTFSFQAPLFYERLGYAQMGRSIDTPSEHAELMFAKEIVSGL